MTEPTGDPIRDAAPRPDAGQSGEGQEPSGAAAAGQPGADVDLGRRGFFRAFAGELFQTAATVAGAAQALQRASAG